MAKRTKAATEERNKAIEQLREWIKPGDTVHTILDHVSSSGMSRAIRVVIPYKREDGTIDHLHPNYAIGKALELRHWKRNGREQDALVMGGCGMDMGFALVYELSHVLYGARLERDIYLASATTQNKDGKGPLLTREGAPEGQVYVGGYACLGKGKCPSNYHNNHRDNINCPGHDGRICWKPSPFSRFPIADGWPESEDGRILSCLHNEHDGGPYEVCPTCKGVGTIPNPDGPERFDLTHTDGYALRHRWL